MADEDSNFFSRWSRRKAGARAGLPAATEAAPAVPLPVVDEHLAVTHPAPAGAPGPTPAAALTDDAAPAAPVPPPPPTLADVAQLTRDSDYSRYVAADVSPEVKNAALKQLFTDPHYNVMDGLDIYIGDYNTPDPLPAGMLRKMVQSQLLGLFDDEPQPEAQAAPAGAAPPTAPGAEAPPATPIPAEPAPGTAHEDTDLQLQPDDGAGRPGAEPGAGPDTGRPD